MNNIDSSYESWKEFAKKCISLNGENLIGEEADFSDMCDVHLLHIPLHEGIIWLKVSVNFTDNTLHYYVEDIEYLVEEFNDIKQLVDYRIYRVDDIFFNDLTMNKELYPPHELTDRLIHWGYEILKPIDEHNKADLRFNNCKESCSGRIPTDLDISYLRFYSYKTEFDGHPIAEGDVLVVHGDRKIYTFQLKDDKFRKVDNFFMMD